MKEHSSAELDQFFTQESVARHCADIAINFITKKSSNWMWIEPSAGKGVFLDCLPFPRIGLDIVSLRPDITQHDFLSWYPKKISQTIAVIGNPPFGKNSSLARKFFDHASKFADVVAFILPRTFEKHLFINRLNPFMHIIYSEILKENSFVFEENPYSVPTVFQIWEKRADLRKKLELTRQHNDFYFSTSTAADFAFQRVGARAGLVSYEGLHKSPQSHYFVKSQIDTNTLFHRFKQIDWTNTKYKTAGNPSIGKAELITTYETVYG